MAEFVVYHQQCHFIIFFKVLFLFQLRIFISLFLKRAWIVFYVQKRTWQGLFPPHLRQHPPGWIRIFVQTLRSAANSAVFLIPCLVLMRIFCYANFQLFQMNAGIPVWENVLQVR